MFYVLKKSVNTKMSVWSRGIVGRARFLVCRYLDGRRDDGGRGGGGGGGGAGGHTIGRPPPYCTPPPLLLLPFCNV